MSIFRPAVKYGFVIAVVIGISLSYVNRYEWFPQLFKQASKDTGTMTVKDESSAQPDTGGPAVQPDTGAQIASREESGAATTPEKAETGPAPDVAGPAAKELSQGDASTPPSSAPVDSRSSTKPEAMPAQQAAIEQPGTPGISPTPGGQTETPQGQPASEPMLTTVDQYIGVLLDAREAYWQGNYPAAADKYQEAVKIMPDNPDAYGELGNLYYSQGQWEHAGDAYYQAAVHLLASGDIGHAVQLNNVIQGLAPERAQELQKRIQSVVEKGSTK